MTSHFSSIDFVGDSKFPMSIQGSEAIIALVDSVGSVCWLESPTWSPLEPLLGTDNSVRSFIVSLLSDPSSENEAETSLLV